MNPEHVAPKVFISHASEDKERFVESFAKRLRENGIDAWLDKWEIAPGDDLPQSIFEKGIASADCVIVVLSPSFVAKPWPNQELSASIVRRVYGDVKIIPVVIENCTVPHSLQATLWVKIEDLTSYDHEFKRIVNAILDRLEKPPLGRLPQPSSLSIDRFPGLNSIDTSILKKACELTLITGDQWVQTGAVEKIVSELNVSQDEATESLEILENRHMIKPSWVMGRSLPGFRITTHGFENYARFSVPGFSMIVDNALVAIVNHNFKAALPLATHMNQEPMLIEYVLDILEDRKLIQLHRVHGSSEGTPIHQITSLGKRRAAEIGQ
jgi:hypothetical protein